MLHLFQSIILCMHYYQPLSMNCTSWILNTVAMYMGGYCFIELSDRHQISSQYTRPRSREMLMFVAKKTTNKSVMSHVWLFSLFWPTVRTMSTKEQATSQHWLTSSYRQTSIKISQNQGTKNSGQLALTLCTVCVHSFHTLTCTVVYDCHTIQKQRSVIKLQF